MNTSPENQSANASSRMGRPTTSTRAITVNANEAWLREVEEAAARRGINRIELIRAVVGEWLLNERLKIERAGMRTRGPDRELASVE